MGWERDDNGIAENGDEFEEGRRAGRRPFAYVKCEKRIDLKFIQDAKEKRDEAWKEIRNRCNNAVRKYIKEDVDAQEEILQQAIVRILEHIDSFDPERGSGNVEANFVHWINESVRIEFLHWQDRKRRDAREVSKYDLGLSLGLDPNSPDFEEETETILMSADTESHHSKDDPELKFKVKQMIEALREFGDADIQEAYILYYVYGYTTKEVAEALGKKESTVNTWLHRYRDKLREHLKRKGIDESYFD